MTQVIVLDGHDVPNPEDMAMLTALYSRSPASVLTHLEKVRKVGSGKFMGQFYLGYGHASVGELGETHIFIEGCSMAAAKAIQDDPLYRGQEASTRYQDFSKLPFFDPTGTQKGLDFLEQWRALYMEALPKVLAYVKRTWTKNYLLPASTPSDSRDALFEKTCKAMAFDICRGLLPIGATTNVAWAVDLRRATDHLRRLMIHPLAEVRDLAMSIFDALSAKYPNSFGLTDDERLAMGHSYLDGGFNPYHEGSVAGVSLVYDRNLASISDSSFDRKRLPYWTQAMKHAAAFEINDWLDYASYRDLQRHRNGYTSLSVISSSGVTTLHPWYTRHLDIACGPEFYTRVKDTHAKVSSFVFNTDLGMYDDQYFFPMMTQVHVNLLWNLGQVLYALNLRSSVSVHPTLREKVAEWAPQIEKLVGRKLFSLDTRGHYEASTRGNQDMVEKK